MIPHDDESRFGESIDLLVDGELDEASRRILLGRLDTEPDGWKRCGLAFLEAQAWRGAMAPYRGILTHPVVRQSAGNPPSRTGAPNRRRAPWRGVWIARAAMLCVAFGLGWLTRPTSSGEPPTIVGNHRPLEMPPQPVAATVEPNVPPTPSPSYARGRLEREGYQVEKRVILVPGSTRDGRPVGVPVEQVKVRFVGNRAV